MNAKAGHGWLSKTTTHRFLPLPHRVGAGGTESSMEPSEEREGMDEVAAGAADVVGGVSDELTSCKA